jgi:hypothetical protein
MGGFCTKEKDTQIKTNVKKRNISTPTIEPLDFDKIQKTRQSHLLNSNWHCPRCTFINVLSTTKCQMCNYYYQIQTFSPVQEKNTQIQTFSPVQEKNTQIKPNIRKRSDRKKTINPATVVLINDDNYKIPTTRPPPLPKSGWKCNKCAFINSQFMIRCLECYSDRHDDSFPQSIKNNSYNYPYSFISTNNNYNNNQYDNDYYYECGNPQPQLPPPQFQPEPEPEPEPEHQPHDNPCPNIDWDDHRPNHNHHYDNDCDNHRPNHNHHYDNDCDNHRPNHNHHYDNDCDNHRPNHNHNNYANSPDNHHHHNHGHNNHAYSLY